MAERDLYPAEYELRSPLKLRLALSIAAATKTLRAATLIFFMVVALSSISAILGHHADGVAVIWLSNGLVFGMVVRRPRTQWAICGFAGCVADILGSMLIGETVGTSIAASLCNSLEIFLAAWLLTRLFGSPFRLSRPRPLFGFLAIGVIVAPAVACALSALWLTLSRHAPWWTTYRTWFLGDALGMAIIAPFTFALQEPGFFAMFKRRALGATLLVLTAPALAAALDFSQGKEPIILFLLPSLVFVAFRLGFPGTVVGIFLTFCIAVPLTVTGHGPMMFSLGTSPLHKIVVVQIFLAISLFTAFPVASLLEERTSLERALKRSEAKYIDLANTDALTGQANRRAFDERLETEWRLAARLNRPLGLLSMDIDLFKSYNDLYGHIAGDDCLRHVAALASQVLHKTASGQLYRLGGEEFAAVLPDSGPDDSHAIAESIGQAIFAARIEHRGSPLTRQTVSIGVASRTPQPDQPALSLLSLSDRALYTAKQNGRNQCELAV